jgi:dethiobiotin synthetase
MGKEAGLNTVLIAGTGAGVGKTVVLSALIAYWQRYCPSRSLAVLKPVECRDSERERDCDQWVRRFDLEQSADQITPITLSSNLAPAVAAAQLGTKLNLEQLWQNFHPLQQRHDLVLLEAWGGLGSPLTAETTTADLAWDWRLPTVLVVPVQPETIAQAVANVALAVKSRVHLKGIVLNAVQPCSAEDWANWAPIDLIQSLTRKAVLGCLPYLDAPEDLHQLIQQVSDWELEQLLPDLNSLILG